MDTSEKYIEMCEKAEEIREGYTCQIGDFYRDKDWPICRVDVWCETCELPKKWAIWLPRQDQLQEMVEGEFYTLIYSLDTWMQTNRVAGHDETAEVEYYDSMEQLWLGYVMSEKYNKEWNGKEFIKKEV